MADKISLGPFVLENVIGQGGMAAVWRACHASTGTPVAVKVLSERFRGHRKLSEGFVNEVQAVASMRHPGIIDVFDYGTVDAAAARASNGQLIDGAPYLVQQLARGSLRDVHVPRRWGTVRDLLLVLLDALAYAHAREVFHRDLKPDNVLVLDEGAAGGGEAAVAICDFGIAHVVRRDELTTRKMMGVTGSPGYMPPEQLRQQWRDYGPPTDIYALGCTAYEIVCGRRPFSGDSALQVALAHFDQPAPPLVALFSVPDGFEQWVHRAMAKAPGQRFPYAADAAHALLQLPDVEEHEPGEMGATSVFVGAKTFTFLPRTEMFEGVTYRRDSLPEPISASMASTAFDPLPRQWLRPFPIDWRAASSVEPRAFRSVGLSLLGLREPPFVGREPERDALWQALGDVNRSGSSRAVLLSGSVDRGLSRLAQWLVRRGTELGVAHGFRAVCAPFDAAGAGLASLLDDLFATWQLDRTAVLERVTAVLENGNVKEDEFAKLEARALTEILRPTAEAASDSYAFGSRRERFATVVRALRRKAEDRPICVWIDDAQWAPELLEFVVFAVDEAPSLPVLFVVTLAEDRCEPGSESAVQLEKLRGTQNVATLTPEPLSSRHMRQVLDELVPLQSSTVADRVVAKCGGRPLYMTQLLAEWNDASVLEPEAQGFRLQQSAGLVTLTLRELLAMRVARLRNSFSEVGWASLLIGATLGLDVHRAEWEEACEVAGVAADEIVFEEAVRYGLAKRRRHGWTFVHELLVELTRDSAASEGLSKRLHEACAEALTSSKARGVFGVERRLALHLTRAGRAAEAVDVLRQAAREHSQAGHCGFASELLALEWELLDELQAPHDDRRRLDHLCIEAGVAIELGDTARGERVVARLLELVQEEHEPQLKAYAYRAQAQLARRHGDNLGSLAAAQRGEKVLEGVDAPLARAILWLTQEHAFQLLGRLDEAEARARAGAEAFAELGAVSRQAEATSKLAQVLFHQGELEPSREAIARAIELAKVSGSRRVLGDCWNNLGELSRASGDFREAARCYRESERLDELQGSQNVWVSRINIVLTLLAAEDVAAADEKVSWVERTDGLIPYLRPYIYLARLLIEAIRQNWAGFDAIWQGANDELSAHVVDRDSGWLAARIAETCRAANEFDRAQTVESCFADG